MDEQQGAEQSGNEENVEAELDRRIEANWQMQEKTIFSSLMRGAVDVRRRAKAHRRLIPYIRSTVQVLNFSQNTFDLREGIEAALELIALLESPQKASNFQHDYSKASYERQQSWLLPAYHMYAERTAAIHGFNSEGMQQCIAEGQAVCRRTGSIYVTSFREFAADVFYAADDLEMALHHARASEAQRLSRGKDRRWIGAKKQAWFLLGDGRLTAALEAAGRARELAKVWHTPLEAMLEVVSLIETALHLLGRPEEFPTHFPDAADWLARASPEGEDLDRDLHRALSGALAAACRGDHAAAIATLTHWDGWLTSRGALNDWFEVRVRLIAAFLLAGERDRGEKLARVAIPKARAARDFRTLRRIRMMLESAFPVSPLATLSPCDSGSFAPPARPGVETSAVVSNAGAAPPVAVSVPDKAAAGAAPPAAGSLPSAAPPSPLRAFIQSQYEAIAKAAEFPQQVLTDLLACDPRSTLNADEACHLLQLMFFLVAGPIPAEQVWAWAQAAAGPYTRDPGAISLLAALGGDLRRKKDPALSGKIDVDKLESLHRSAMELDADRPGSFTRAGFFFLAEGNAAEAERCLARAARLDRSNERVAAALADLYARTGRRSDALAILDLCIRQGARSADTYGHAAVLALSLSKWMIALTFLERLEALKPGAPWTQYNRSVALLELKRYQEALDAADLEGQRNTGQRFHLDSIRAAALASLGRPSESRESLVAMEAVPLRTLSFLTLQGIEAAFRRAWPAIGSLPADDPLRRTMEQRAISAGLAPDALFLGMRRDREKRRDLNHYLCTLRQPLDERWADHEGCLPGQEKWPACHACFGVLAASSEEAAEAALAVQRGCYLLEPEVVEAKLDRKGFFDHPGVTWKGPHNAVAE